MALNEAPVTELRAEFPFCRRTDETAAEAREALADLLNASRPEEIVFGPNMTTLTFNLSRALGRTLSPGDEIVVTRLDHDANIAPWQASQEQGAVIRHADFDASDCTRNMASLEAAITPRTKLVALGYASDAVGTIDDVRCADEMAHAVGAWVYVDAVHYAPHGPIDAQALDCDFLVCSTCESSACIWAHCAGAMSANGGASGLRARVVPTVENASGKTIPYEIVGRCPGDIPTCYADPSKANREMSRSAERDMEEMCTDVWRWQSNNPNGYD